MGLRSVFDELTTADLPVEHAPAFIEFEDHFNLLETVPIADQNLAANVIGFAFVVQFQAGFVIDIDLPLDGFSAALAFDGKRIKRSGGTGRGEKILKDTHGGLLFL
jgi:hypothetical protein